MNSHLMKFMQNTYSQNSEDLFVLNYFGDFKGTLLEIGANDGVTFSNSKLLIDNGWKAHLVEPGYVNNDLSNLHNSNSNVAIYDIAIGDDDKIVALFESGTHIPGGNDRGLVSSASFEETKRWPGVKFDIRQISMITFANFYCKANYPHFDFISIDAEGFDAIILQQIDLKEVSCKCLCIEWNSKQELFDTFTGYCAQFGMRLGLQNAENLIFIK